MLGGSVYEYGKSIVDRETSAVNSLNRVPGHLAMLCGPEPFYRPTTEKKAETLRYYSEILETILPQDRSLTTAHLWHNDLHETYSLTQTI